MYMLLTWAPPVAVAALVVALYNTYLKRREEAIQGWLFTTSRAPWIDDGRWKTVSVKIRVIGAVAAYEVETHVWNTTKRMQPSRDPIPKMTCETDPIELQFEFDAKLPAEQAPWVGVTWTDPTGWIVKDEGARVNVKTDEYQRWVWHKTRWLKPFQRPTGEWRTVETLRPRKHFRIPKPDRRGQLPVAE
ncbi:hypothetical protein [Nocardia farcinica]|uniref:Uncharacterized protein n=1 Tax=Nocardia farcinica (strain IFM 10152) TaxID=247156 RepID=Q5YSH8_NOCFA|nr:hypothetical protein [Nocardia farcinica]BAD58863.1 hypothetical protein NFA_40150 [Nocardia farcinica IFM 10152]